MSVENNIDIDLYHKAPFGYITTHVDGTIININETLLKLIQADSKDLLGKKRFQDLLTVGGKIYYETHYLPLLIHQKEVQEISFDIRYQDGERIPVLVNTTGVKSKNGELYYLSSVIDISQRKLFERELMLATEKAQDFSKKLKEANQELHNFAHVLTHDVKTPLNNIIGLLDLFESGLQSGDLEDSNKYLRLIKTSTISLVDLIDGILKYHLNSDLANQKLTSITPKELINKVAKIVDPESKIELETVGELKAIETYTVILEMILLNLMVNAVKYNDKEIVKLKFSVSSDERFYRFSLSDNGRGIAEKDFQRIFEPLNTLEIKDRFNSKGTGLGLSYVKKMVEKMGGTIQLESKLGEGSRFSFTILKSI